MPCWRSIVSRRRVVTMFIRGMMPPWWTTVNGFDRHRDRDRHQEHCPCHDQLFFCSNAVAGFAIDLSSHIRAHASQQMLVVYMYGSPARADRSRSAIGIAIALHIAHDVYVRNMCIQINLIYAYLRQLNICIAIDGARTEWWVTRRFHWVPS